MERRSESKRESKREAVLCQRLDFLYGEAIFGLGAEARRELPNWPQGLAQWHPHLDVKGDLGIASFGWGVEIDRAVNGGVRVK